MKKLRNWIMVVIAAIISIVAPDAQNADAGKGWCRSEPIVVVDGIRYQLLGGSQNPQATYLYSIYYADSYEIIATRPQDELAFFQSDDGFVAEVLAFNEEGEEIESILTIRRLSP